MLDALRKRHIQRNMMLTNYEKHYGKLVSIMKSTQRNFSQPDLKHKKFKKKKTKLNTSRNQENNLSCSRLANLTKHQSKIINQNKDFAINKIFFKSNNARQLYPNQHYFHVSKQEHLNSYKKIIMLLIRFTKTNEFAKTSQYMLQVQPFKMKSPILQHYQLSRDIIGFKFKYTKNYVINLYQIRGNSSILLLSSNDFVQLQKHGILVQIKIKKRQKKQKKSVQTLQQQQQQPKQMSQLQQIQHNE